MRSLFNRLTQSRLTMAIVVAGACGVAAIWILNTQVPDDIFTAFAFACSGMSIGIACLIGITRRFTQDVERLETWDALTTVAAAFFAFVSLSQIDTEPDDEKVLLRAGIAISLATLVAVIAGHAKWTVLGSRWPVRSSLSFTAAGSFLLILVTGLSLSRSAGQEDVTPWVRDALSLLAFLAFVAFTLCLLADQLLRKLRALRV